MSTKHTVTLPDSTIATRTSATRVYPFAVALSPETKTEIVENLRYRIERAIAYIAECEEALGYLEAGGELVTAGDFIKSVYAVNLPPRVTSSVHEQRRGQRWLGGSSATRESIIADTLATKASTVTRLAEYQDQLAAAEAGPEEVGAWSVTGWQSRLDLAHKEQAKQAAHFPGRRTVILNAEYVTK